LKKKKRGFRGKNVVEIAKTQKKNSKEAMQKHHTVEGVVDGVERRKAGGDIKQERKGKGKTQKIGEKLPENKGP